jgi:hypothetical protein
VRALVYHVRQLDKGLIKLLVNVYNLGYDLPDNHERIGELTRNSPRPGINWWPSAV